MQPIHCIPHGCSEALQLHQVAVLLTPLAKAVPPLAAVPRAAYSELGGFGMQKAAVRACRNAIEFNSIPCIQQIVPNGYAGMQIHVKIGVPDPVRTDQLSTVQSPSVCQ